ncbi:recombinase family protein [Sphaerobacter thermophilus]|uniref:Resolvase domain protein n=1 Tax=Sphaerobacter thermophilus (strain ATCC 49802 / DSM 20745 / KCCM 41009 / NCIMB 13125 / S 6022) TaxID=479434 RepID=D1C6M6_SPHTD|nr:recombinase family protein [Sphaerobacter thermophilus]ACZ39651.1 Resolvase domain protein [Sphaerobacter thermophilus DSM 20745]
MGNGRRAAIYARVSSEQQERDGTSLDTQLAACRQYAAAHGYEVVAEYREVFTGVNLWDRRELTALREAMRRKEFDVVIAYAIDRLSRDPVHLGVILSEADHHGAAVEFVTEPLDNSPEGQLIRFVRGYAAKVEHEKFRERAMRGRRARAETGKLIHGPRPLYGYQWADADKTRLVVNPETAPIVQRIFREAAEGRPLRAIARGLTDDGIPTPTGKPTWSMTTVSKILKHPHYTGDARAWTWQSRNGYVRNHEAGLPLPEGTVPPLVDRATFELVQEQFARNQARAARNNRNPEAALLRGGYVRCGYCGRAMHVHKNSGKPAYRCNGREYRRGSCPMPVIAAHVLDAAVWERVEAILTRPEIVAEELARLQTDDPTAADLAAVDRLLQQVDRQRANLTQAIGLTDDPDAVAALMAELERVAARRRQLEAEREGILHRREAWEAARANLADLMSWCERVAERLGELTYEQRRLALDALGISVQVYRASDPDYPRYVITAKLPLDEVVFPSRVHYWPRSRWRRPRRR